MTEEQARLTALQDYSILDTLPEKEFDDIVEMACAICDAPISMITLLDSHRQWFKARLGIEKTETPIEQAFCRFAIQEPDQVMVVPDSWKEKRFDANPLAYDEASPVRFYAGAPLITAQGQALGTLCVIDNVPREFSEEQKRLLRVLAERVMKQLELRRDALHQKQRSDMAVQSHELILQRLLEIQQLAQIGSWDWNFTTNELYWSPEMYRLFGVNGDNQGAVSVEQWQGRVLRKDMPKLQAALKLAMETGEPGHVEFRVQQLDSKTIWLAGTGRVSKDSTGALTHLMGTAHNITDRKNAEEQKEQYTQALEEMLFAVSHQFRKPVANLFGLVKVLNTKNISPENIQECLPHFKECASELDGYIRQMNDLLHQRQGNVKGE